MIEQLKEEYDRLNQMMMQYALEDKQGKEYQKYYTRQKQLISKYDDYLHQLF